MRSMPYEEIHQSRKGIPRWALLAATPLILALGFISGIALSAYRPVPVAPATSVGQPPAATPDQPPPTAPPGESAAPADQSARLGLPALADARPTAIGSPLPHAVDEPAPFITRTPGLNVTQTTPSGSTTRPASVYGAAVRTVVDARAVLTAEFGAFRVNDRQLFAIDYQVARDANYGTVLIGIVKIAEYGSWQQAVLEYPAQLETWMKAAALRVKSAELGDNFTLTWTIFEKVSEPPYGFAAKEVTRDPKGGYVVTRLLAAVTDPANATVTIAASELRPTVNGAPWSAYGPVIRFDSTDLYRPTATRP